MKPEVLIIGTGVIGLSLARSLRKRGIRKITILEGGEAVGREASFAAAGILAPQAEADRADEIFRFCNDSNKLYPQFAAELFDETGIDIELDRSGTLYLAFEETDVEEIRKRFKWQKKAGLTVERLSAEEVRKAEPFVSPGVREALYFPNDWQVENRRLMAALERFSRLNDIRIVTGAMVKNLLVENGKIIGAETNGEKFFAEAVVLATGAWTSLIKIAENALPLVKIAPIRGQMLSFKTVKRLFFRVVYSPRGYLVPRRDGRILAGATVENTGFDKSVTAEGVNFVSQAAFEIAPNLVKLEISDKWAGLRPFAADGLPVLGAVPEIKNLFVATAHYRNGILLAPKTGEILADIIVDNRKSEYLEAFGPRRFAAAKAS